MGFRYVVAGGVSLTVSIIIATYLVEMRSISPRIAAAISFIIIFVINFFIARTWVFKAEGHSYTNQISRFFYVNICMRAVEYLLFLFLLTIFAFHYATCMVSALLISNMMKFLLYKELVFHTTIGADEKLSDKVMFSQKGDEAVNAIE